MDSHYCCDHDSMNGNDDRSKNDNDNDGWFWLDKDIFKSSDMMNSGSIRQSLRMLRILLTDLSCGWLARHLLGGFGWDLNFGSTERTDGIFSYSNIAAIGWYMITTFTHLIGDIRCRYDLKRLKNNWPRIISKRTVFIEHAIVGLSEHG